MQNRSVDLLRLLNRPERSPRKPRRSLGSLLVAMAVLCATGEAVLRVAPSLLLPQHRIQLQQDRSVRPSLPDPELGLRSAPGLRQMVYTPEYEYLLETDAQGFPNRAQPARADVVVLGGSAVTGQGVGVDGQFSSLLAQAFPEAGVLNLGLPAAGPEQQYRTWHEHAAALAPRVVISVLCVASDVDDALLFEAWRADGGRQDYAAFRRERGAPGAGNARLLRLSESVTQSYLLRGALYGLERATRSSPLVERIELPSGEVVLLSLARQRALVQGLERPASPALAEALVPPLERLAGEVRATGATFLVVLLPSKEELYGASAEPALLRASDALRGRLGTLPVLDLYPPLRDEAQRSAPFFGTDPHLNALGNRLVAGALGAWLRDSGALASQAAPLLPEGQQPPRSQAGEEAPVPPAS